MPNDNDIKQAADILSRLEPGYLPNPIFQQLARLTVLPVVELVPLRVGSTGAIEVLLTKRDAADPVWPGQLHVPGTVIRSSDETGTFKSVFNRLLGEELSGTNTGSPVFVANMLNRSLRGAESSLLYWVEVIGPPKLGTFYDSTNLPESTVKTQLAFIERAVDHFKSTFKN